jgi:hypothetical protein
VTSGWFISARIILELIDCFVEECLWREAVWGVREVFGEGNEARNEDVCAVDVMTKRSNTSFPLFAFFVDVALFPAAEVVRWVESLLQQLQLTESETVCRHSGVLRYQNRRRAERQLEKKQVS